MAWKNEDYRKTRRRVVGCGTLGALLLSCAGPGFITLKLLEPLEIRSSMYLIEKARENYERTIGPVTDEELELISGLCGGRPYQANVHFYCDAQDMTGDIMTPRSFMYDGIGFEFSDSGAVIDKDGDGWVDGIRFPDTIQKGTRNISPEETAGEYIGESLQKALRGYFNDVKRCFQKNVSNGCPSQPFDERLDVWLNQDLEQGDLLDQISYRNRMSEVVYAKKNDFDKTSHFYTVDQWADILEWGYSPEERRNIEAIGLIGCGIDVDLICK